MAMARRPAGETSKADMVRSALEAKGWDQPIGDYHSYIKETFGEDMSKQHISQQISNERKKQGKAPKRRGRKKGSKNKVKGAAVVATTTESVDLNLENVFAFVAELNKWETKLGSNVLKQALKMKLKA
jgi:hypothetical protein